MDKKTAYMEVIKGVGLLLELSRTDINPSKVANSMKKNNIKINNQLLDILMQAAQEKKEEILRINLKMFKKAYNNEVNKN